MSRIVGHIVSNSSLTVIFDSGPRMMRADDASYSKALAALSAGDADELFAVMNPVVAVNKFTAGNVEYADGVLKYKGQVLQNYIVGKIRSMIDQNLPWEHMVRFIDRLMANPSSRAVTELYKFLETENLPITDDGCFLAYKRVRKDFKDIHSGTIDNTVGLDVRFDRNMVDDNPNNGCSHGLHAGALSYVHGYGSSDLPIIIVKIDPADVVSIPREDVRKLRCCGYKVISAFDQELTESSVYSGSTAKPVFSERDDDFFCDVDCTDDCGEDCKR